MRTRSSMSALMLLVAGCDAPSAPLGSQGVRSASPSSVQTTRESHETASPLTIVDYLELGEQRVRRHLASSTDPETLRLAEALGAARGAVVRVRVNYARTAGSYQTDNGSGFFVGDGRFVLTAGHALVALEVREDAEILLTCTDGRTMKARPVRSEFSGKAGIGVDLGILEVVDAGAASAPPPSLRLGTPKIGSLVAVIGYPGQIGVGSSGALAGDDHVANNPLRPLVSLCRVRASGDVVLDPVAGCVPEGGMSGGPVIDADGRVIGVQASVSREQTGGRLVFTVNATSVAGVDAVLAAAYALQRARPR